MSVLPMALLVDPNGQRLKQNQHLASRYFQTEIAVDYADAFSHIKRFPFHLAIIDKTMGPEIFSLCLRSNAQLWVMAVGESWTEAEAQALESVGVRREDIFQYPFELGDFAEIAQALGMPTHQQQAPVATGPYNEVAATLHEEPVYAPRGYETPPVASAPVQPINHAPNAPAQQQTFVQGPYVQQTIAQQQAPQQPMIQQQVPMQQQNQAYPPSAYPNQQTHMGYGQQLQQNVIHPMNMSAIRKGVYAIYSPKGGVGKTTIAVNMGLALAKSHVSVCLVDLDVFYGNVGSLLNLTKNKPYKTVLNWVDTPQEMDQRMVMDNLMKHESGLWTLPCPRRAIEEDHVTAEVAEKVITYLRHYFDVVLIDLGPSFKDPTVVTFQLCDKIMLISELDLMTISDCNDMVAEFKGMGVPIPKVEIIFNNVSGSEGINMKEISQLLSHFTIIGQLPADSKVKWSTNKQGMPALLGAPKAPFAKAIQEMTYQVFGLNGSSQEKKRKSLFSLFQRNKGGVMTR